MPVSTSKEQLIRELTKDVANIVISAVEALESGCSTAYARNQLREMSRRLQMLEQEYRGGCSW